MKCWLPAACAALMTLGALPALAETLPKWLADGLAREAALPEATAVTSDDGWFSARVPGAVKQRVALEGGGYSLTMQLAGGVSMSCEVIPGARDLAALMAEAAEISFREIAKVNGAIQARAVEATEAGVVGSHPFLAMRWMYRALNQGEQRVGGLQQYVADLGEATVYCAHDELGYIKTFQAVTQAVTRELRVLGVPVRQPYFREVSVLRLNGRMVGVANVSMYRDDEGDTQVLSKSAMLVQRAQGELLTQDSADVEWLRPDGSLINASQVKAAGGKLSEEMALKLTEDQRWRASGTIAGKEVSFDLEAAPDSYVTQARARRQLLAQDKPVGTSIENRSWTSLDLTRLLPSRATVLAPAGNDGYAVREDLGGVAIEMVLDSKTGTMRSAKLPVGALTLDFERILQQGSF